MAGPQHTPKPPVVVEYDSLVVGRGVRTFQDHYRARQFYVRMTKEQRNPSVKGKSKEGASDEKVD